MKYIAICARGLEDITQLEIQELLKVNSKVAAPGRVLFESKDIEKFISKTQSVIKVYEFKQECEYLEDVKDFEVESPFRVSSSVFDNDEFISKDVESRVGFKFKGNVDLKNPKTIVFVDIVGRKIFVGIDKTPELLSKREYRVKINNQSINACISYALVRLSGYNGKKVLLDPFSKDGVFIIEAARYKKGKIFALDGLFPNVRAVEVNSQLAGVRKEINISRIETQWLDTKFGKSEIDLVVSAVPYPSKTNPEKDVLKLYKELFHQLEFIMKKKSCVVFIAPTLVLLKLNLEHYKIVEERNVSTSNWVYDVVVLKLN